MEEIVNREVLIGRLRPSLPLPSFKRAAAQCNSQRKDLGDQGGARHHCEGTAEDIHHPLIGAEEPDEEGDCEGRETDGEPGTVRNPPPPPSARFGLLSGIRLPSV